MGAPTAVTASDGVTLAVHPYTDIDPRQPTVLAVHGYPDNHHVWDAVAQQLAEQHPGRYNVVAFDVRGAGGSSAPRDRSGYRLAQLVADIDAVISHLGVDRAHLLGHDWGSIQGWAAVTDPAVIPKIASYTSISGPHLDYAGAFLRSPRSPRAVAEVAKQILASGYIWLFLTPALPEALFRSGMGGKVVAALDRIGGSGIRAQRRPVPRTDADYRNGLNLYRANMPAPLLSPVTSLPESDVPVQVLAPRKDIFVRPAVQQFAGSILPGGRVVLIEGGHWVVTSRPDVVARLTAEWVDRAVAGESDSGASEIATGRRDVRGRLAVVTGAGAGIGRATAVELARRGVRTVVVIDRERAPAEDTADLVRAAGSAAVVGQVDVGDEAAVCGLADRIKSEHGVADILVNVAGIGLTARFLETTAQDWDTILAANVRGVVNASRVFAEQMVQRGQGGTIINVASAAAYLPSKSRVADSTTHAAVLAFSESLRADLAGDGITVTAVCPAVSAGSKVRLPNRTDARAAAAAKAIVGAVGGGPPVLPVAAESRFGYAMRRISPASLRLLARYPSRRT